MLLPVNHALRNYGKAGQNNISTFIPGPSIKRGFRGISAKLIIRFLIYYSCGYIK